MNAYAAESGEATSSLALLELTRSVGDDGGRVSSCFFPFCFSSLDFRTLDAHVFKVPFGFGFDY